MFGDNDNRKFRNSGPKSRNGCITCKIRRVKCGEEKPTCERCASTGRKCDGYADPKQKRKPSRIRQLAANHSERHCSVVPHSPSVDIEGSFEERRSFHYFRSRNMSDMPGNFEPYFWDHLVLQFSHEDPTTRYSLIALSAIYEEHECNQNLTGSLTGQSKNFYVIQQYTKALRNLADGLVTGQADPRVTLVSCLIFIWIEFLQGNLDSGFSHLKSGLQILQDMKDSGSTEGSTSPFSRDFDDMYGSLDRSFKRLSIQASIHGSTAFKFIPMSKMDLYHNEKSIPAVFSDIFEARDYLDSHLNFIFACMREVRNSDQFGSYSGMVSELLSLDSTCQSSLSRLRLWQDATQNMMDIYLGTDNSHQLSGITYLQLYHTYMVIILKTPFATSEMIFDGYTSEFERIVSLAESLLVSKSTNDSPPPMLSFDMGVIPPLFLVILKCRDIRIRRKALVALKRAPEQEGLWRRADVVAVSEWKINLEEQGRGQRPETILLPESARTYQEHLNYETREGKKVAVVQFRRSGSNPDDPPVTIELNSQLGFTQRMGNML